MIERERKFEPILGELSGANMAPALLIRTPIRGSVSAISAATRFISEMRVRSA
jgi:hypothetical protein